MRVKRMGGGASAVGAPASSSEISKLRTAALLGALAVIVGPFIPGVPPEVAEWLRQSTPHSAVSIAVNVFWPQITTAVRAIDRWIRSVVLKVVDKGIKFFMDRAARLKPPPNDLPPGTEDSAESGDAQADETEENAKTDEAGGLPGEGAKPTPRVPEQGGAPVADELTSPRRDTKPDED